MSIYVYVYLGIYLFKYVYLGIYIYVYLGSLNSIAAGLMIYVALVQMIADDFKQSSIATNVNLKIKMFSALSFGTAIMAILGYWA
jgi:zinc transporter 1/2/3